MSDLKDLHSQIHVALAEQLLQRVRSGEATAAELNVARQYLKDNHISAVANEGTPLFNLATALPFTGDEDDSRYAN